MKNFIYTLTQVEGAVKSLIFMNGGVLLSTEGSEVLEQIRLLEESGVEVLSCGTCLILSNSVISSGSELSPICTLL